MTGILLIGRLPGGIRLLAIHALCSAVTDMIAISMAPANNHAVYTAYLPVDYVLVMLAARPYLGKTFLPLFIPGTVLFFGVYSYILYSDGTELLPFEAIVISWILQAVTWFLVLLRCLRQTFRQNLAAICLIAGAVMLYTCTTVPVWAMFRYNMVHDTKLLRNLQDISNYAGMIRYTACGIAFILLAYKPIPATRHAI